MIPIAAGGAVVLKLMLPDFARELPFSFNYAAVCICAWAGGFVSGLVATVLLAGLTKFLFLEPLYSLSVADQGEGIRVALFIGEGILVSVLGGAYANVKRLATNLLALMRAQTEASRKLHQDADAIRAISGDTIWEWQLDTGEIVRTASWSGTLADVLPVQEEFDSWVERIHPADRYATISRLQRAIDEGRQELQYSYRLRSPGGKFLSIADHAFIVRGDDWKPLRVIGRSAELPMRNGQ
jgi:PAS domain-containing protein